MMAGWGESEALCEQAMAEHRRKPRKPRRETKQQERKRLARCAYCWRKSRSVQWNPYEGPCKKGTHQRLGRWEGACGTHEPMYVNFAPPANRKRPSLEQPVSRPTEHMIVVLVLARRGRLERAEHGFWSDREMRTDVWSSAARACLERGWLRPTTDTKLAEQSFTLTREGARQLADAKPELLRKIP